MAAWVRLIAYSKGGQVWSLELSRIPLPCQSAVLASTRDPRCLAILAHLPDDIVAALLTADWHGLGRAETQWSLGLQVALVMLVTAALQDERKQRRVVVGVFALLVREVEEWWRRHGDWHDGAATPIPAGWYGGAGERGRFLLCQ